MNEYIFIVTETKCFTIGVFTNGLQVEMFEKNLEYSIFTTFLSVASNEIELSLIHKIIKN